MEQKLGCIKCFLEFNNITQLCITFWIAEHSISFLKINITIIKFPIQFIYIGVYEKYTSEHANLRKRFNLLLLLVILKHQRYKGQQMTLTKPNKVNRFKNKPFSSFAVPINILRVIINKKGCFFLYITFVMTHLSQDKRLIMGLSKLYFITTYSLSLFIVERLVEIRGVDATKSDKIVFQTN